MFLATRSSREPGNGTEWRVLHHFFQMSLATPIYDPTQIDALDYPIYARSDSSAYGYGIVYDNEDRYHFYDRCNVTSSTVRL